MRVVEILLRYLFMAVVIFFGMAVLAGAVIYLIPRLEGDYARLREEIEWRRQDAAQIEAESVSLLKGIARFRSETQKLKKSAEQRVPSGLYIVIDTNSNTLLLRDTGTVLRQAVCSTGSGKELIAEGRRWVFDTPKGCFKILAKYYLPVWIKPDWAFYEEGMKPPSARAPNGLKKRC